MKLYVVKTPNFLQFLGNKLIWSFYTSSKKIYLTFDDGPTPKITEWVLQTLKKYDAKATFFCLGKNVDANPEIYNQILSEGHAVGNHTNNHFNGWKTISINYFNNIREASKKIKSNLFRPPYGKLKYIQSRYIRKKMKYNIIMWDVISADFDTSISGEECYQNVIKHTENGSIIVFHDSVKAESRMKYALPKVLEYYATKGYSFEKIDLKTI
ncbi:polysaccharide deacetylase family protein [Aureivirga sp. CE67]|uniref:polysaccharide deacetylase family protein n=1 Tax=Aureivirga sp. CE67 TaxID=1788983 RepID=UPI0018C91642|nr:polysaccharide deacetylase family protein [Aureivirga sp. CE67]